MMMMMKCMKTKSATNSSSGPVALWGQEGKKEKPAFLQTENLLVGKSASKNAKFGAKIYFGKNRGKTGLLSNLLPRRCATVCIGKLQLRGPPTFLTNVDAAEFDN